MEDIPKRQGNDAYQGSANSAWVPRQCGTRPIGRKDRPRIVMEGPLVSDTTEFLSGATDASGETPLGRPASAGDTGPEGSHAGSSAPAGSDGAAAATGRRRQGTGLSALRLPELQQVAQQMGIAGTARLRKSQLIAAIQEKQGGGATEPRRSSAPSADRPAAAAASSEVATAAAGSEVSAPRAASAGADASRPLKQDAMETPTSTETGNRRNGEPGSNGVQASSPSDQGGQQLSFDSGPAADAAASAGSAAPQAASGGSETATESPRGDGQHTDAPRGDRRRRSNNGRDGQQSRGRGDNNRDNNRGERADNGRDNGRGDSRDRG